MYSLMHLKLGKRGGSALRSILLARVLATALQGGKTIRSLFTRCPIANAQYLIRPFYLNSGNVLFFCCQQFVDFVRVLVGKFLDLIL